MQKNTKLRTPAKRNIDKLENGSYRVRLVKNGVKYDRCFKKMADAKLWRNYLRQSKVL